MNSVVESSSERSIRVFRDDQELKPHDIYKPGEKLLVQLSDEGDQFAFEVRSMNGIDIGFEKGGCNGKRSDKKRSYLNIPENAEGQVVVWAGWSRGHSVVTLTEDFILEDPKSKDIDRSRLEHESVLSLEKAGAVGVSGSKSEAKDDDRDLTSISSGDLPVNIGQHLNDKKKYISVREAASQIFDHKHILNPVESVRMYLRRGDSNLVTSFYNFTSLLCFGLFSVVAIFFMCFMKKNSDEGKKE